MDVYILADDKGLQEPIRCDRGGKFGDGLVRIRLADIAVPGDELVERDGRRSHVVFFGLK